MTKYGGRKFILSVVILLCNFILFYFGKLDQETWKWIVTTIFGAYVIGNSITKFTNGK